MKGRKEFRMKAAAVIDMLSPRSFKAESYSRSLNVGDWWRFRGTSRCSFGGGGIYIYMYMYRYAG